MIYKQTNISRKNKKEIQSDGTGQKRAERISSDKKMELKGGEKNYF